MAKRELKLAWFGRADLLARHCAGLESDVPCCCRNYMQGMAEHDALYKFHEQSAPYHGRRLYLCRTGTAVYCLHCLSGPRAAALKDGYCPWHW